MAPPIRRIPPRYEFKYALDPAMVPAVREAIQACCRLDPASVDAPRNRYLISSLYLDTPLMAFHRAKLDRQRRRIKLRIRTYPSSDNPPVLLEVKRRIGDVIVKGRSRAPDDITTLPEAPFGKPGAAADFLALMHRTQARPFALVRYAREAYESEVDHYARVTFDWEIQFQPMDRFDVTGDDQLWRSADDPFAMGEKKSFVILELKFAEAFPTWMAAITQRFNLWRRGYSKYCTSADQLLLADQNLNPLVRVARP